MKVTINPSLGVPVEITQWTINRGEHKEEPQRVTVEKDNKSYSILFFEDDSAPVVEVWSLDINQELGNCLHTICLPQ